MTSLVTQGNDDFQGLESKRKSTYVCLRKCDETEKRSTEAESTFNHTPSHTKKMEENAPTKKG